MDGLISYSNLLELITAAQKKVPAVKFALAVAAVAAAAAIVNATIGQGKASVVLLGGVFIAMILMFAFSRLVSSRNPSVTVAGVVLLWAVIIFFCTFLTFTVTAFALVWPEPWAEFLGVSRDDPPYKDALREIDVPKQLSNQFSSLLAQPNTGIIRLQPRTVEPQRKARLLAAVTGGGAYYSFVQRTHEYGQGSDVEYDAGILSNGFAGADYGFFLNLGQRDAAAIASLSREVPSWIPPDRKGAWDYAWSYRPPTDIKLIRLEQKRSHGFVVDGVNLSSRIGTTIGGLYLLRSINIGRSDILVALFHVATLDDNSVVVLYRVLSQFDTPIATGSEN
jgi:hypothetical protein